MKSNHIKKLLLTTVILLINCNSNNSLNEQLGYKKNDILLIVNADDVGMHPDITDGIYKTMEYGICKSASIMVPCPDFHRAISLWKKKPEFELGIHLTLTVTSSKAKSKILNWQPILPISKVPSLYNPEGYMWHDVNSLLKNVNIEEALMELEAQIEKFIGTGLYPTHLNGHMTFYLNSPKLLKGVLAFSKKYNIPLRPKKVTFSWLPNYKRKYTQEGLVFTNSVKFFYNINGENEDSYIRKIKYYSYLKQLKPGLYEIGIHPGYVNDPTLKEFLDNPNIQLNDLSIWSNKETKELLKKHNIKIIGHRELQKLQAKKLKFN